MTQYIYKIITIVFSNLSKNLFILRIYFHKNRINKWKSYWEMLVTKKEVRRKIMRWCYQRWFQYQKYKKYSLKMKNQKSLKFRKLVNNLNNLLNQQNKKSVEGNLAKPFQLNINMSKKKILSKEVAKKQTSKSISLKETQK